MLIHDDKAIIEYISATADKVLVHTQVNTDIIDIKGGPKEAQELNT